MADPKYETPKGLSDITPEEQDYYNLIQSKLEELASAYNFEDFESPLLEKEDLFREAIGEATAIVKEQLYSFEDEDGAKLALRPDNTSAMGRAFVEDKMKSWPKPIKLSYFGPVFRQNNPHGDNQFYQAGFEMLGSDAPIVDALIIQVTYLLLKELGLEDINYQMNHIGCEECRSEYRELLSDYVDSQKDKLTPKTKEQVEADPLQLFSSTEPKDRRVAKKAPQIVDEICSDCKDNFKKVLEYLGHLDIPYVMNPLIVRGFEYDSGTIFEITPSKSEDFDPQDVLGSGGRYDDLIEDMGAGKQVPACGATLRVDRIIEALKENDIEPESSGKEEIFLMHLGERGRKKTFELMEILRKEGISFFEAMGKKSLKAQTKVADKNQFRFRALLAQKEALDDKVILKDTEEGTQDKFKMKDLPGELRKRQNND